MKDRMIVMHEKYFVVTGRPNAGKSALGGPEPTLWKVLQVILIGTSLVLLTGMRYLSDLSENSPAQILETYS